MKLFSYTLVLVLSFFETFAQSSLAEKCKEQRVADNENSLRRRFPQSLNVDDSARRLDMKGRGLKSINVDTFESFDKPRTAILDLSINRISEIASGAFQSFENMKILNMRINNLREINATTFSGLMTLEELDLSRNIISDVSSDALRMMINLHTIDLSENCMFQLPNYLFFRNVRLINIYLKRNHLRHLPILMPVQHFVENFNISGNHFTNMTSLSQFNNIQSLDLSDNPFSSSEMAADLADVATDAESSSESDENNNDLRPKERSNLNYKLNIRYVSDAKYTLHPLLPSSQPSGQAGESPQIPFSRRRNQDRIDSSPDVNFMATSRARMNTMLPVGAMGNSQHNRKLEYLMEAFRPNRMSEEALESLIKTTMQQKSEDFKVTDMIQFLNTMATFYKNQNRQALRDELEKMKKNDEHFDMASLVQFLEDLIRSQTTRLPRNAFPRHTSTQLQQLIEAAQTNHLRYFTCRNCSLRSLDFLVKFPELKYADVTGNQIKTVNMETLDKLKNMRYLFVSDNEIESLNFTAMLENWPDLQALLANDNPNVNCDLIAQMKYKVAHLNKMFLLEASKCK